MFFPPALVLRRRRSVGFFGGGRSTPSRRNVPPEFEWVQIQMDITRWAITGVLGVIALGVWTGGMRLNDLGYSMTQAKQQDIEHNLVNQRQDKEIGEIKTAVTEHRVYLEQILAAVRSNGKALKEAP
jgi:hypothetical protein